MTDDSGSFAGFGPAWVPPPPPSSEPEPAVAPARRRRPLGIVGATVAVVAVLVAGVVAVTALTGPSANTPEDAVRGLLTAAGNGDALGVLDHVDPAERGAVASFLTDGTADLARLGVLAPDIDLHHISGISASFSVDATHNDLRPGLATVQVTGGSVHAHVDAAQLPLGAFVRQHAGTALGKGGPADTTSPLHITAPIATVLRGGTWYVSIGYTAAEAARRKANLPLPDPNASVPAVGAPNAEAAVEDFLHALANVDVERLIELTPPDEMAALHDYAPLFLPNVKQALSHSTFSVAITSLELDQTAHGDGELVSVKRIGVHATVNGTTIDLAPGSKCPTVTGATPVDLSAWCAGTAGAATSALPAGLSDLVGNLRGTRAQEGFVVVEHGGAWYVSPTRTVLDGIEAVLHAVPSDFLTKLFAAFNPASLVPAITSHVPRPGPADLQCVNGVVTMTLPSVPGSSAPPPVTIPCPAGQ
ncbi:MAG TPA: hypothetical protein VFA84_07025 [Acidimicrobiales bacterium]|nr:hypothetical protein [Acidimicrobiales bacterium]